MPFPTSVRGSFTIARGPRGGDVRARAVKAAAALLAALAGDVTVEGETMVAHADWLGWRERQLGGHPMIAFDRVRLAIGGSEREAVVSYEFSARRLFVVVSCLFVLGVAVFGSAALERQGTRAALQSTLVVALVAYGWFFGMNYVVGWLRGPAWLRRNLIDR